MKICPHCNSHFIIKKSFYFVKVIRTFKRRYFCKTCNKYFSSQTTSNTYYQKKPYLNEALFNLITSGNTLRGSAKLLQCSRLTVDRKFQWLAQHKIKQHPPLHINTLQIDEMQTIEHTKLKPITIPLCVTDNYQILSIKTGKIPATGHLAKLSVKKYGFRENEREKALTSLFLELKSNLKHPPQQIITDGASIYKTLIEQHFPQSKHTVINSREQIKKKKELLFQNQYKKLYDPMFALNQRCAKLRADIRRLTRRSWCTTKKIENLEKHLELYRLQNNLSLV